MPVLDILDRNGGLRWDAPGVVESAIYYPCEPDMRLRYEALWRVECKYLLPAGKRISKRTYELARAFGGKARAVNRAVLRKYRARLEHIGTALWLQLVLSQKDPSNATESKVSYILSNLEKKEGLRTSRSTLKRDWARYRGTAHFCAAVAYQRRVFGAPLLWHPTIGPSDYTIYAALWDFLRLNHQFFSFARDSGCFATTESFNPQRDLWTMPPNLGLIAPGRNAIWPNCHRIRSDVLPDPAILAALGRYSAILYRA
jgi:hypothetical protein